MTLLEFKDLKEKKGIPDSDTTIWRKIKAGQFPKPLKMGRRNCWVEEEIDQTSNRTGRARRHGVRAIVIDRKRFRKALAGDDATRKG